MEGRRISLSIEQIGRGMVYLIMVLTLFQDMLVIYLHFPSAMRMLNDGLLLIAVSCAILQLQRTRQALRGEQAMVIAFAAVLIVALVSALYNGAPILLAIWSARQNFRGIVFLFAAVIFCSHKDVECWFNVLFWLQIPNAVVTTVEYFYYKANPVTRYFQDAVGGIFGTANSSLNVYVCIMVCYGLFAFLEKQMSWWRMLLTMVLCTYVAILAEVRIVFIYYVMIFGIMVLIARNSRRKWILVGMVGVMFVAAMALCEMVFPGQISKFMMPSNILNYVLQGFTDADPTVDTVLPRIGSFRIIAAQYFNGIGQLLLGIGFGNAEDSSFSFLQSAFAREHVTWMPSRFMCQMTFLQTGILGIASLVIFLVVIAWNGLCRYRRSQNAACHAVSLCMAVYSVVLIWYDGSIRYDICFLLFWALAVGSICAKRDVGSTMNH